MLDIIIRNAQMLDGTGSEAFRADVGVKGDRVGGLTKPGDWGYNPGW